MVANFSKFDLRNHIGTNCISDLGAILAFDNVPKIPPPVRIIRAGPASQTIPVISVDVEIAFAAWRGRVECCTIVQLHAWYDEMQLSVAFVSVAHPKA